MASADETPHPDESHSADEAPPATGRTEGRTHYTAVMKLRAIEFAEIHGNRATGRALGMDESIIRKWRQRKEDLEKLPPRLSTLRRGIAKHPALEKKLKEWVLSQHQKGRPVTVVSLRFRALALAKQSSIEFGAGPSWAYRFLRRSGLQTRKGKHGINMVDGVVGDDEHGEDGDLIFPEGSLDGATVDPIPPPVTSKSATAPNGGNTLLDLHSKFRKCELRILGVVSGGADVPKVHCELCDQQFQFERPTNAGGLPSIRDLRICEDCLAALRRVRHLSQPVRERDERLDALEASMKLLKARLDRLDPDGAEPEPESECEEDSLTKLSRENVDLNARLLRYERAQGERGGQKSSQRNGAKGSRGKGSTKSDAGNRDKGTAAATKSRKRGREPSGSPTPGGKSPPFTCFVCDSSFKSQQLLQQHVVNEHETRNHFPCPACPQQFTSRSTLQRHLKQHPSTSFDETGTTGGCPDTSSDAAASTSSQSLFHCPFCSETFVQRSLLQNHLRKFHQRHPTRPTRTDMQCRSCGKKIINSGNLKSHEIKCIAAADRQLALPVECVVGDAEEPADGSETDRYRELADLLEPDVEIIDQEEMQDREASATLIANLKRLMESDRGGAAIKVEPPEEDANGEV